MISQALRLIIIWLSFWALVRLVMARRHKWKHIYTPKERWTWVMFFVTALLLFEASVEALLTHTIARPREILSLIVISTLIAVTYVEDDRRFMISPRSLDDRGSDGEEPEDRSGKAG